MWQAKFLPSLIVCPLAVVDNWKREFHNWVPDFDVVAYKGSGVSQTLQQYVFEDPIRAFMPDIHVLASHVTLHLLTHGMLIMQTSRELFQQYEVKKAAPPRKRQRSLPPPAPTGRPIHRLGRQPIAGLQLRGGERQSIQGGVRNS